MYNACQLRYSDTNFFGKEVTYRINFNYVVWTFKPYATDMNTMIEARSQVMEELKERVPDSSLLLYNYTIPCNDSLLGTYVISGLAQCTRDMAPSECNRCISVYTGWALEIFPNNSGGAIKGYNCYLRYQLAPIELTMTPERAPPPMLAHVPTPPSTPRMPRGKSSSSHILQSGCIQIYRLVVAT
jgi:hypothetical protein